MKILHILNGDATLNSFEDTGLDGDTMVWRGILSEGPLEENISSGGFWRNRLDWVCKTLGETRDGYQERMLDQLTMLSQQYDEINLWFEFDLHCQANLMGVMTYLKQKADLSAPAIYLICPGSYPGKENFRGMGELSGEELEYLYDNIRMPLSGLDFIVAEEAWSIYVRRNKKRLADYIEHNDYWGSLHFLKPALEAELTRLRVNNEGLNGVEQKLLDIFNSGITTKTEIYDKFRDTEKIYGMGDKELDLYLDKLKEKKLI